MATILKILDDASGAGADWTTFDAMVDWFDNTGGNDLNGNPPLSSIDDVYWVRIKKKGDNSAYTSTGSFLPDSLTYGVSGFLGLVPHTYATDRYDLLTDTGIKLSASVGFNGTISFNGTAAGQNFCAFYMKIENTNNNGEALRFGSQTSTTLSHLFHGCHFKSPKIPANTLQQDIIFSYSLVEATGTNSYAVVPATFRDPYFTNTIVVGASVSVTGIRNRTNGAARLIAINTLDLCSGATESFRSDPDASGVWGTGSGSNAAWDGGTNTPPGTSPYSSNVSLTALVDFTDPSSLDFTVVSGSGLATASAIDNFSIYESGNYDAYSVAVEGTVAGTPDVFDLYGNQIIDGTFIKLGVHAFSANSAPQTDFISTEFHLYDAGKPRFIANRDLQSSDADGDPYFFNIVTIPAGFVIEKFNGATWDILTTGANKFTQQDVDDEKIRVTNNSITTGTHDFDFTLEDDQGNISTTQTMGFIGKDSSFITTAPNGTFLEIASTSPVSTYVQGFGGVGGNTGGRDAWSRWRHIPTLNCLLFWGGGHNDSFDNNGYCFDLDNLFWYVLDGFGSPNPADYKNSSNIDGDSTGVYSDGIPTSRHTYNQFQWVDDGSAKGQIVVQGCVGVANPNSGFFNEVEIFDLNTLTWLNTISSPKFSLPWTVNDKAPNAIKNSESWAMSVTASTSNLVSYDAALETNFTRNMSPSITSSSDGYVNVYHPATDRIYIFGATVSSYLDLPAHNTTTTVTRTNITLTNSDSMEDDDAPPVFMLDDEVHVWRGTTDMRVLNTGNDTFTSISVDGGNSFIPPSKAAGLSFTTGSYGSVQGIDDLFGKRVAVVLDEENDDVFIWVKEDTNPGITIAVSETFNGFTESINTNILSPGSVSADITELFSGFSEVINVSALEPGAITISMVETFGGFSEIINLKIPTSWVDKPPAVTTWTDKPEA